jgi:hypothetical protein
VDCHAGWDLGEGRLVDGNDSEDSLRMFDPSHFKNSMPVIKVAAARLMVWWVVSRQTGLHSSQPRVLQQQYPLALPEGPKVALVDKASQKPLSSVESGLASFV